MTSAQCTEFYPAVGLRVWVAAHAVADAEKNAGTDTGAAWLPATVVGAPVDAVGQWAVQFGAADVQRTERVAWTVLAPRSIDATSTSAGPSLPPRTLSTNTEPMRSEFTSSTATGRASLKQSELSATRAAYRRDQFEQNAARHWDLFYRSNTVNFFKDRHWLDREFPEIDQVVATNAAAGQSSVLVECGCGVGNALFPLIAAHPTLHGVGVDFSRRAIDFVKAKPEYAAGAGRCDAHVCDLATEPLAGAPGSGSPMMPASADIAMLCFVLSAVAPQSQSTFLAHVWAALKPSGLLLFRDYADGDLAQKRFRPTAKINEDAEEYVRHDGTLTYFFTEAELRALVERQGFVVDKVSYIEKEVVNRAQGVEMGRRWLQLVARKREREPDRGQG